MAVAFDTTITRGVTEWKALPEELMVNPDLNGRHDLPDIQGLIDSILTVGQLQPVTIRKSEGKPVLVAGYSRWRAVTEINKRGLSPSPMTLRCSYTQLTDEQAFLANIHENRVRNETTPMDDAYNIQRLINVYQKDEEECADIYRASKQWIRDRLSLLELVPEAAQAVVEGRVKPSAAKTIAKLSREHQKAAVAKPGKVTAKDVKSVTPKAEPKPAKAPAITVLMPPSLRAALKVLFAECDAQPDVMVYEIHRDVVRSVREAM